MKITVKLSVRPTKKGVTGEISWTTEEGKSKQMSVPSGLPIALEMDGAECQVEMEGGKIIRLEVEGRDLMAERRQPSPKVESHSQKKKGFSAPHGFPHHRPPGGKEGAATGGGKVSGEIYDVNMAKLPVDTAEALATGSDIENFNLQLNKAAPFWEEDGPDKARFAVYLKGRKEEKIRFDPSFPQDLISSIWQRQEQSIKTAGVPYAEIKAKIDWRLVVGLGGASVYETSMTLHHIYGIPYIPGSALKGVTRSCYIIEKYGQNIDSEEKALNDPMFQKIFGHPKLEETEANKGFVVFHDAFPETPPKVEPDVMNPHYGPYYSDKGEPPADYHNPVPITFLTVQNTTFRFYLSVHERAGQLQTNRNQTPDEVLTAAKKWLEKALTEFGIGAKTAVGYGYMNPAQ